MRAFCISIVLAVVALKAGDVPRDYSKEIVGCWLGPRKFEVYHTDGTWGVKRNEDAPRTLRQARRVERDKLVLRYPSDRGFDTATFKIISCTEHELILDADGYTIKYTRYSVDCQKET